MPKTDDSMFGNTKPGKNKTGGTSLKSGKPAGARPGTPAYDTWLKKVRMAQATASRTTMRGLNTLAEMSEQDETFQSCCGVVGVTPTRRQYSKWCNKRGAARTQLRKALNERLGQPQLRLDKAKEDLKQANKAANKFDAEEWVGEQEFNDHKKWNERVQEALLELTSDEGGDEPTVQDAIEFLCENESLRLDGLCQLAEKQLNSVSNAFDSAQDFHKKLIGRAV